MTIDKETLERRRRILKDKIYGSLNEISRNGFKFYYGLSMDYSKFQEEYHEELLTTLAQWTAELRNIERDQAEYDSKEHMLKQLSKKEH
jgi:phosphomannomutase